MLTRIGAEEQEAAKETDKDWPTSLEENEEQGPCGEGRGGSEHTEQKPTLEQIICSEQLMGMVCFQREC